MSSPSVCLGDLGESLYEYVVNSQSGPGGEWGRTRHSKSWRPRSRPGGSRELVSKRRQEPNTASAQNFIPRDPLKTTPSVPGDTNALCLLLPRLRLRKWIQTLQWAYMAQALQQTPLLASTWHPHPWTFTPLSKSPRMCLGPWVRIQPGPHSLGKQNPAEHSAHRKCPAKCSSSNWINIPTLECGRACWQAAAPLDWWAGFITMTPGSAHSLLTSNSRSGSQS